ncbi:MAG: tRNA lysidine(34) synthetase TilS, partial [Leptospirales bacterium]
MTGGNLTRALFAAGLVDAALLRQIDRGGPCILAVSGGRDSMFLLYLFRELLDAGFLNYEPLVFHLNHGLREDARQDLDFVAREARRLDFAFYFQERKAAVFARRTGASLEEAGRILRYRALGRLRSSLPTKGWIVTAHHADDYLESVLMHLIRGGGPGAMNTLAFFSKVEGVPVARPLVAFSRARIKQLVAEQAIPFVEDPSNRSERFLRNRLRHGSVAALRGEGLEPVKLWRNFHDDPRDTIFEPSETSLRADSAKRPGVQRASAGGDSPRDAGAHRAAARPDYLSIDRRLFPEPPLALSELKLIFDFALRRLGLAPADRNFLSAMGAGLAGRPDFRLAYLGGGFRVWSDRRGPVWIFRNDAAVLRPARFASVADIDVQRVSPAPPASGGSRDALEIRFNGRARVYRLRPDESPAVFRPGLRARLGDGSHVSVRKLLREAGVPEPVREFLPLIVRRAPDAVEDG